MVPLNAHLMYVMFFWLCTAGVFLAFDYTGVSLVQMMGLEAYFNSLIIELDTGDIARADGDYIDGRRAGQLISYIMFRGGFVEVLEKFVLVGGVVASIKAMRLFFAIAGNALFTGTS